MRFEVTASAKTDFQFYHFSFLENLILESPLDSKETKPINPKGNQHWLFTGRTDAEAEAPVLWPPDVKNWLIIKRPWCWKRLKAGGKGDDRGWDGWMASSTMDVSLRKLQEIVKDRRPGMLQSIGSQRVWLDWVEQQLFSLISHKLENIKIMLVDYNVKPE